MLSATFSAALPHDPAARTCWRKARRWLEWQEAAFQLYRLAVRPPSTRHELQPLERGKHALSRSTRHRQVALRGSANPG